MRLPRFIRALFAWEGIFHAGAYCYQENRETGARRCLKIARVHSPIDTVWLAGGLPSHERERRRPPPPSPVQTHK